MDISEAQGWVLIIGTMTTGIAAIIGAVKAVDNSKKADINIAETKVLAKKSDEIHVIVNSSMTELRAKNDLLMNMMAARDMEKVIAENTRVTLASTIANAAVVAAVPVPATQVEVHKQVVEEQVVKTQVVEEPSRIIKAP